MSLVSLTPVAGRIAEIRSVLGTSAQARPSTAFGRHLEAAASDAVPTTAVPTTAVSIEEAARSTGIPSAALAALTRGATTAAPDIVRSDPEVVPEVSDAVSDHLVSDHVAPLGFASAGVGFFAETNQVAPTTPYAELFNEAGRRHDVDPILLASVAEVESAFDPNAVSSAGAGGLMQFMPATAAEMGVERFDPTSAVDGAARYLARDLERFGQLDLAIAAYNAGPGAVERHGGIPPFTETENYVRKVLIAMENHR